MMTLLIKTKIYVFVAACFLVHNGFAQAPSWEVVDHSAVYEKSILLPGRNAHEIYNAINMWLVSFYERPEEIVKAKIDDRYLKGKAYRTNIAKGRSTLGLRYTFTFEIKNQVVHFRIHDAVLTYPRPQDEQSEYSLESYIEHSSRSRNKNKHCNHIVNAVTEFSNEMVSDIERQLQFPSVSIR
jgi:hypothetical protein